MFVKLRKCWRMLQSAVSLGTPENSAIQKLSIIISIIIIIKKKRFLKSFVIFTLTKLGVIFIGSIVWRYFATIL